MVLKRKKKTIVERIKGGYELTDVISKSGEMPRLKKYFVPKENMKRLLNIINRLLLIRGTTIKKRELLEELASICLGNHLGSLEVLTNALQGGTYRVMYYSYYYYPLRVLKAYGVLIELTGNANAIIVDKHKFSLFKRGRLKGIK